MTYNPGVLDLKNIIGVNFVENFIIIIVKLQKNYQEILEEYEEYENMTWGKIGVING